MPRNANDQRPFVGFEPITANFLYCPNQFIDVCIAQCSNRGVVRIVAYVIRQTLGWVDEHGNPIYNDVTVSRKDIIEKAGVSNGAAGAALDQAVALGFLICTQEPKPDALQQTSQSGTYELCWDSSGDYITDLKTFQGFKVGSHFTPVPNQFFDVIVRSEPLSNVKVVGTLIRHTIGFTTKLGQRKKCAALSQSTLAEYTNLSTGRIINGAIQATLERGYIQSVKQGSFDSRGREFGSTTEYALNWREEAVSTTSSPKKPAKKLDGDFAKKASETSPKRPAKKPSKKTSNRNTSSKDNNKDIVVALENQEAFTLLMQVEFNGERFNETIAMKLAKSRGLDVIKRQIVFFPKRNVFNNPLGGLYSAIMQDWSPPLAVKERQRNRDAARKEEDEDAVKAAQETEIQRAKKVRRLKRKQAIPRWNALPMERQREIEEVTFNSLNNNFDRHRFRTNEAFHLEKCIDEMCCQEEVASPNVPMSQSLSS